MTSLVFDEDPSEVTYQQASLRSHLLMCLLSLKIIKNTECMVMTG